MLSLKTSITNLKTSNIFQMEEVGIFDTKVIHAEYPKENQCSGFIRGASFMASFEWFKDKLVMSLHYVDDQRPYSTESKIGDYTFHLNDVSPELRFRTLTRGVPTQDYKLRRDRAKWYSDNPLSFSRPPKKGYR